MRWTIPTFSPPPPCHRHQPCVNALGQRRRQPEPLRQPTTNLCFSPRPRRGWAGRNDRDRRNRFHPVITIPRRRLCHQQSRSVTRSSTRTRRLRFGAARTAAPRYISTTNTTRCTNRATTPMTAVSYGRNRCGRDEGNRDRQPRPNGEGGSFPRNTHSRLRGMSSPSYYRSFRPMPNTAPFTIDNSGAPHSLDSVSCGSYSISCSISLPSTKPVRVLFYAVPIGFGHTTSPRGSSSMSSHYSPGNRSTYNPSSNNKIGEDSFKNISSGPGPSSGCPDSYGVITCNGLPWPRDIVSGWDWVEPLNCYVI